MLEETNYEETYTLEEIDENRGFTQEEYEQMVKDLLVAVENVIDVLDAEPEEANKEEGDLNYAYE